ncbi:MAG: trypsin-like peptidase domain-containing protein, partial [Paracoccaceae bacterium]
VNGNEISTGTGFFLEHNGSVYLISNLHNFTGRDIFTGKHLSNTLAEPDEIHYLVFENGDPNRPKMDHVRIRTSDGEPMWISHPSGNAIIDIAAIQIDVPPADALPINKIPQEKIYPNVTSQVFILGYPAGVQNHITPIWKSGNVATEIDLPFNGLPVFLVDSSTTSGMSGSPVIFRSQQLTNSDFIVKSSQPFQRFVGVYSGRIPPINNVDTQLGFVWSAITVYEVVLQQQLSLDFWDPLIPNRQGEPPPGMSSW